MTSLTRTSLLQAIDQEPQLRALIAFVRDEVDDGDDAHGFEHFTRVALWALRVQEKDLKRANIIAAAFLHDIVNVPKNSPLRAQASQLSADRARAVLPSLRYETEDIEEICDAIRDHSYSRGATPTSALGRALQDADRLETLGAIGLMRVFATGARMEAAFAHPTDPWATHRPLEDTLYSIDHFFTKLLQLSETLLTPKGRTEAHRRRGILITFLHQLASEIDQPLPDTLHGIDVRLPNLS